MRSAPVRLARRRFLSIAGLGAAALVARGIVGAEAVRKRPNVILVLTDDQGYGDLSCHGNPELKTPSLDRLHHQSVRLTDFHVDPLCTPTRAALMTGRYSARTGAYRTSSGRTLLRRNEVTLADVFAANGYRTGHFGKWHLGDNYPYRPIDRGFHISVGHKCGGVGQISGWWGNNYFDDVYLRNEKPERFKGYCNDVWFAEALAFIEANRDRPFFCYIPTNIPHGPYLVAERYKKPYLDMGIGKRRAAFYGMIANLDENVARLTQQLDDWRLADDTILIFMTDNGTAAGIEPVAIDGWPKLGFNAGMRGKKASHYEGGHRCPCFIRWPKGGLGKPRDIGALTAHIDLLPTLVELCALKPPDGPKTDGRSLTPLLRGGKRDWDDQRTLIVQLQGGAHFRYSPTVDSEAAVLTRRWRMLTNPDRLHDIASDPAQRTNVAAKHPAVVKRLRAAHQAWFHDVESGLREPCPIVVGSDHENPAALTSQDWLLPTGNPPWNQSHVRSATRANGHWEIEVARDGAYEISLRRWPQEISTPITAAIPRGKAIAATVARLKVADLDLRQPIPKGATAVTFRVQLKAGRTRLQGWFINEPDEAQQGPYYAAVQRIEGGRG